MWIWLLNYTYCFCPLFTVFGLYFLLMLRKCESDMEELCQFCRCCNQFCCSFLILLPRLPFIISCIWRYCMVSDASRCLCFSCRQSPVLMQPQCQLVVLPFFYMTATDKFVNLTLKSTWCTQTYSHLLWHQHETNTFISTHLAQAFEIYFLCKYIDVPWITPTPGTLRKAQSLLKQHSNYALDGKRGQPSLSSTEGWYMLMMCWLLLVLGYTPTKRKILHIY